MLTAEIESNFTTFLTDEWGSQEGPGRADQLFEANTLGSLGIFSIVNDLKGQFVGRVPPLDVGLGRMNCAAQVSEDVASPREH